MSRLHINIGSTANDRTGDPLRTAFEKVNANFIELYATTGADAPANQLVNGAWTVSLGSDGTLIAPSAIAFGDGNRTNIDQINNNFVITTNTGPGTPYSWTFDDLGNLTLPGGAVIDTNYDGAGGTTSFWSAPGQYIDIRGKIADNIFGGGMIIHPDGKVDMIAQDGTASASWGFNVDGSITFPNNSQQTTAWTGSVSSLVNGNRTFSLGEKGTLTASNLYPRTFTATVDDAHYAGTLTLTSEPWHFEVEFRADGNGDVETLIANNTPWPSNPGYTNGMAFNFTEADHGIPGYTFTITLYDIQNPGPMMYTTNLTVNPPQAYPATIASAIDNHIVLETSRDVVGGTETATNSNPTPANVFFGYLGFTPTINNVQVGWTVSGTGLVGTKTVTDVALGGFENGYWTITVDGTDGSAFAYNGTYTFTQASSVAVNRWTFSNFGVIRLPLGGDITDSTGTSVLGTPASIDGGNASTTF